MMGRMRGGQLVDQQVQAVAGLRGASSEHARKAARIHSAAQPRWACRPMHASPLWTPPQVPATHGASFCQPHLRPLVSVCAAAPASSGVPAHAGAASHSTRW